MFIDKPKLIIVNNEFINQFFIFLNLWTVGQGITTANMIFMKNMLTEATKLM